MIRGLYTAASGMLSAMRRMELVTNNLANAQTVGFKQDRSALSTFDEVMVLQDGTPTSTTSNTELGQLGMAAVAEEPMIDFTQGAIQETSRDFDLALEETERAVELNPSSPTAHSHLGNLLAFMGEPERGIAKLEYSIYLTSRSVTPVSSPDSPRMRSSAIFVALSSLQVTPSSVRSRRTQSSS